jgi:MFS family permease
MRRPGYSAYLGLALATTLLAFAGLWAVPFFTVAHNLDRGAAAILASLLFIGWGIGAPLLGWLSDRLGRRRRILILCCFLLTVQLVAVIYVPALPLTILSALLLGTGFVGSAMGLTFAGGRACNESAHAGAALGIINTAVMASGAAFQPLTGLFLDLGWDGRMAAGARLYGAADYRMALAVLPVVSALAVIVAMAVKEPRDPSASLARQRQ